MLSSTAAEQNKDEIVRQKWFANKEGLWAGLGAGCLYILGCAEGLTKKTVVIVFAYNTATWTALIAK